MTLTKENLQKIKDAEQIWLLLDYDGTLADFAPTPDDVYPDPELITLIQKLAEHPKIKLAIISGRRLSHIEELVPLSGIWLAGSYGLEMRTPAGEHVHRADLKTLRPQLETLKPQWAALIDEEEDFYLEDKGWSLALHARFANDLLAEQILAQGRALAERTCSDDKFQLLGGHKFLEIAPLEADKGNTVVYLLKQGEQTRQVPVYLGDDDKDERAFPVVQKFGGLAGCVCNPKRITCADFLLESPRQTRDWLTNLLQQLSR
jgi:trehalose 6-phosphate phosphatase